MQKLSEPELCVTESSDRFQRPHFAVDVVIEGGTVDHIEISAYQTGSGMTIDPMKLNGHRPRPSRQDNSFDGIGASNDVSS